MYKQGDPRKGGRLPFDAVLKFKVLVLQDILSDDQTEFQIRDRYSFSRFLGLSPQGGAPDAKTIWLFRERVKQVKLIERLFDAVLAQIEMAGLTARKGQIVDAALVPAPKQRNSRSRTPASRRVRYPRIGRKTRVVRKMYRRVGRKSMACPTMATKTTSA